MADLATLRSLLDRVIDATGPDRELDAAIDVALFGGETVWKTRNYTMEAYPASRRASSMHVGGFANEHVPLVTASLDAAVALVARCLPGWLIMGLYDTGGGENGLTLRGCTVELTNGPEDAKAYAHTRALALLAALFSALIARAERGDAA